MIRNITTAVIALAVLVSIASVAQVAKAVEPEFKLDISAFEDNLSIANQLTPHAFTWTPDLSYRDRVINLYESLVLPKATDYSTKWFDNKNSNQRPYTFEVFKGDGLDDLRESSKYHNNLTLPDEDTNAYGVSVKQRF